MLPPAGHVHSATSATNRTCPRNTSGTCPHVHISEQSRAAASPSLSLSQFLQRLLGPLSCVHSAIPCMAMAACPIVQGDQKRVHLYAEPQGLSCWSILVRSKCLLYWYKSTFAAAPPHPALDAEALLQKPASRCFFHFDTPPHEHIDVLQCRFTLHSYGVPADTCCC
jgi:hypothetical protein